LCVTPTNPPQQNQTKQTPVIGAGRHNCSASRVRVRINSSDNKTGAAAKVAGKVAVLACRMGGERTGFWGGDPPSVCSRASLRERNGHLHNKSPASFHTAGRIEGRALSLLSFLGGKGRTKPKVRSTNRKTQQNIHKQTKTKQVVTHLTSRHAEKKKKRGSFGARILVLPLGGNTKQRSSVPISICASQPWGRATLLCPVRRAGGWFPFPASGCLVSRRRTTFFCGVGVKPTVGGRFFRFVAERGRRPNKIFFL
jgi:hypothetical protein